MVKGMHTISQCQLINRINPEKHITETNDGIILMDKEKTAQKKAAKSKNHELEV